jgi:ATP-binding cassette subfamily E protein 1
MAPKKKGDDPDEKSRIAIVNGEKCKPSKCRQECKKSCPVVKMGKFCIEVTPKDKIAFISEELCIGCNICTKKCPMEAIEIINLPKMLASNTTHRYSANSFKLHRLPMPRAGQVLGLVGTNGIGKSTALKILAGKLKPNLGQFAAPPDWQEILNHFRGSELQNYFTKILEDDIKAIIKPQYVDHIPKAVKGKVQDILKAKVREQQPPTRPQPTRPPPTRPPPKPLKPPHRPPPEPLKPPLEPPLEPLPQAAAPGRRPRLPPQAAALSCHRRTF